MRHRADPVCKRERDSLVIGDGNQWHVAKFLKHRYKVRQIHSPMDRCHSGNLLPSDKREVHITVMEMNQIELFGALEDLFDFDDVSAHWIFDLSIGTHRGL